MHLGNMICRTSYATQESTNKFRLLDNAAKGIGDRHNKQKGHRSHWYRFVLESGAPLPSKSSTETDLDCDDDIKYRAQFLHS